MSNLYIFPLSDLHLGSKHCNLDFFYEWCRKFEDAPDNKAIYLLGDLLEFSSTRIDAYDVNISTHEAMERLIELLEPYKEYIRYACTGNHEARSLKDFNYDITKQIASRLDAKKDYIKSKTADMDKQIAYKEANIEYMYNRLNILEDKLVYHE